MIRIVPTVVPESLADVRATSARYASFSGRVHVDAADGVFAPNTTWTPRSGERVPNTETIAYEAHLMVANPRPSGLAFLAAGATALEAHVEAFGSQEEGRATLSAWRDAGAKEVGVALLFATPLEDAGAYLDVADFVRLMTIPRVGTQGIPFAKESVARVADFHERYPNVVIAVDGGVSEENIEALARAGASRFAVGSAIAKAADPQAMYEKLTALAEAG